MNMKKLLKSINEILESEAGLSQMNLKEDERVENIVDNRYDLLCKEIESYKDKNNEFYTRLISILSEYINKLYDRRIESDCRDVFDKDFNIIEQNYEEYDFYVKFNIERQNKELCSKLFDYICNLLRSNTDVKLSVDILKQLLNRNPKLFDLSVDKDYIYRNFDYKRLCNILRENNTLDKSNISINETYQLLVDTYQLNNYGVFGTLISKEQFKKNHSAIDEILKKCNAKFFAEISQIIVDKLDEKYDRFSIIKQRATDNNNFGERVIKELLSSSSKISKYQLIHQLLTDDEINIDYNYFVGDYYGHADLKDVIALSRNRLIVNDLLSKKENIDNFYSHGETYVTLYELYAIIGKYEEALNKFNSTYNYSGAYTEDYDDDFNRRGYTYAGLTYEDTLTQFIKSICKSFKNDKIDYNYQKNMLYKILNNDKTKYINLNDIIPIIKNIIQNDDLNLLLDILYKKYKNNSLGFINYSENFNSDGMFDYYIIKLETEEKVKEIINGVKEEKGKVFTLKK